MVFPKAIKSIAWGSPAAGEGNSEGEDSGWWWVGSCRERGPHPPALPAGSRQSLRVCVADPRGHGAPREWMRVAWSLLFPQGTQHTCSWELARLSTCFSDGTFEILIWVYPCLFFLILLLEQSGGLPDCGPSLQELLQVELWGRLMSRALPRCWLREPTCGHGLGRRKCQQLSHVWLCATPWTAARLLCPQASLGKNTGVGGHFLLQGIFPTATSLNLSIYYNTYFDFISIKHMTRILKWKSVVAQIVYRIHEVCQSLFSSNQINRKETNRNSFEHES